MRDFKFAIIETETGWPGNSCDDTHGTFVQHNDWDQLLPDTVFFNGNCCRYAHNELSCEWQPNYVLDLHPFATHKVLLQCNRVWLNKRRYRGVFIN